MLTTFGYSFRATDSTIQTGPTANAAIERPISSRLDDIILATDFGIIGDGHTDNTIAIQRAIDQLFLNPVGPAYIHPDARVTLIIPPGVYNISSTIFIPSYASISGAGVEKTIISHSGSTPVFRFVNDLSTPGNPVGMGSTLIDTDGDRDFTNDPNDVQFTNQPRFITISNISIITSSSNQIALQLEAVRNSIFQNINITGNWNNTYHPNSIGISLLAFTALVTCEANTFGNITIAGFSYAVFSLGDTLNNIFNIGYISNVRQAFVIGSGADAVSIGQQYGPRDTHISNYKFYNIKQHAILCGVCYGTMISDVTMVNVGNDGSGINHPKYPQVYFTNIGNNIQTVRSDRTPAATSVASPAPYIPEVSGECSFSTLSNNVVAIAYSTVYVPLFRLPMATSSDGVPTGCITHCISYFYKSTNNFCRSGTILITADVSGARAQLSDEYNYAGTGSSDDSMQLDFRVSLLNISNAVCTGADVPYTISVKYANTLISDAGYFHYTYNTIL